MYDINTQQKAAVVQGKDSTIKCYTLILEKAEADLLHKVLAQQGDTVATAAQARFWISMLKHTYFGTLTT